MNNLKFIVFGFLLLASLNVFGEEKCSDSFATDPDALKEYFDHTLLKPDSSHSEIIKLVDQAIKYKLKAVCVNSCRVKDVVSYLNDSQEKNPSVYRPSVVATVGFPLGASDENTKFFESNMSVANGANELDIVMNIGKFKDGDLESVSREIRNVVQSADVPVKVIIETNLLTNKEIKLAARVVAETGADFVKTSTGFVANKNGIDSLLTAVRLIKEGIKEARIDGIKLNTKIKASGGIKYLYQVNSLIKAGATRIGASSSVEIIEEAITEQTLSQQPPKE